MESGEKAYVGAQSLEGAVVVGSHGLRHETVVVEEKRKELNRRICVLQLDCRCQCCKSGDGHHPQIDPWEESLDADWAEGVYR